MDIDRSLRALKGAGGVSGHSRCYRAHIVLACARSITHVRTQSFFNQIFHDEVADSSEITDRPGKVPQLDVNWGDVGSTSSLP